MNIGHFSCQQRVRMAGLLLVFSLGLSACADHATDTAAVNGGAGGAVQAGQPVTLQDVMENTPERLVGISFDPALKPSAALAAELSGYAEQARTELQQALDDLGNDKPRFPYELSLGFEQTVATPELIAVSADGSLYTGGAHGMPLVERFVWLVGEDRRLTADELIPRAASRQSIASYAEAVLLDKLQTRLQAERLEDDLRREMLDSARSMISEGTEPISGNFRQFQPVVDAQGRISAIRFVFPPYQVGPYSDGVQTVDVPVSVILPHVDARFAHLFAPVARQGG